MRAGRLRHPIVIERATETRGDDGSTVQTWRTLATVWADVRPVSGREQEIAARTAENVSHRIELRYRPGVDARCRIVWGARVFGVQSVINEDERDRTLVLYCQEAL